MLLSRRGGGRGGRRRGLVASLDGCVVLDVTVDWSGVDGIGLGCMAVCLGTSRQLLSLYIPVVDTWTFLFICLGRMVVCRAKVCCSPETFSDKHVGDFDRQRGVWCVLSSMVSTWTVDQRCTALPSLVGVLVPSDLKHCYGVDQANVQYMF